MKKDLREECLLYRKHIFNYFYRNTGYNCELSEDLTQQTFTKIYVYFDKYNITKKEYLPTWMLKVAKNILYDHLRKKKEILQCDLDSYDDETFDFGDNLIAETNIENDFLKKDLQERINKVFDTLSPREKEALLVFKMNVLDGLEYRKIAKIMNKSNDTLRQGSVRLRKVLRIKLSEALQN